MKIRKSVLQEALKVLGKVVSQTSPVEVQRSVRFLDVCLLQGTKSYAINKL